MGPLSLSWTMDANGPGTKCNGRNEVPGGRNKGLEREKRRTKREKRRTERDQDERAAKLEEGENSWKRGK